MTYRYLKARHCAHLVHLGETRTRHGLQDKELMDRWFLAQQQDQFRDDVFLRGFLNMSDVGAGQVLAQLHCVTFPAERRGEGAEEHLLFLKASAPPSSGLEGAAAESPVVIMDYYGKSNTHRDAPLWTQMSCTMSFRMQRGAAAKLFSTLALAPNNLLEPGLSKEIIDWAGLAAAGTQYANKVQAPETPRKTVNLIVPRRPRKSGDVARYISSNPPVPWRLFG
ncbi:hypothetical protein B0H16DRAFT_1465593 [Mycena metata]|uniref:Uncharacterized protein n=1 Tax=Mycena metata TaxID=1033252 RepID=A0AAD7IAJ2_9AGAR|nr:hypothetical protein B0H16DRAFT_1465593 [Mycena metata]